MQFSQHAPEMVKRKEEQIAAFNAEQEQAELLRQNQQVTDVKLEETQEEFVPTNNQSFTL